MHVHKLHIIHEKKPKNILKNLNREKKTNLQRALNSDFRRQLIF